MLSKTLLNRIENAEIDVKPYDSASRVLPTQQDEIQRRESLLKNGLINPIILTKDNNQKLLIVDGYFRYKLIRELKTQNLWNEKIRVIEIPFEKAKNYRDIQTNHKNYSKTQLAIYAVYHYWDDVKKVSKQRQKDGKKAIG